MIEERSRSSFVSNSWLTDLTLCISVLDAQETVMCNSGLTVTDSRSGEVLYNQMEAKQCKIHNYCQTVTVTVKDVETRHKSEHLVSRSILIHQYYFTLV